MPLRNATPLRIRPRGVCDTLDGTNSDPGAMQSLSNLIPDPSTPNVFYCRPACTSLSNFTGFSFPKPVSAAYEYNDKVYGLLSTDRNFGKDEPFCYDLIAGSFITVSGVTSPNCPVTEPTTGDWTPPTMALVGIYLIVTHVGFPGGTGTFFGWFDLTNPAAPVWNAGNTTGNALPAVPTAVAQFSNRAYFAVNGNQLEFTDALTLNVTNASQVLVLGDTTPITALSPMTLTTTTQGILQALLAFKGNTIFQITGDISGNTIASNSLNTASGTLAPRSVVPTPQGVFFMANDGLRRVNPSGEITDPDTDIRVPFISALYPSRVSAQYNSSVYRICVQNSSVIGQPFQEYWFDLTKGAWTGPHTFRQDLAIPYNSVFLVFSNATGAFAHIWRSEAYQSATSTFSELGAALIYSFTTPPIPDNGDMMMASCAETTLNLAFAAGSYPVVCTASDAGGGGALSTATITPMGTATLWDFFTWGSALWLGAQYGLRPHYVAWTNPLTFTKMVFQATGQASLGFKISNLQVMYQPLGYFPPM